MPTRLSLILAIAVLLALAAAGPAAAATVSNTNDSGPGSLRQAIAEAGEGETISVPAGTYSLSSEPLEVKKSLTLAGAGSSATIIRSVGPFRVFTIAPAAMTKLNVTLSDMMIRDGRVFEAKAEGGGIAAINTNLTLLRANLTGNLANANGEPGEAGGLAVGGGAVVVSGTLSLIESQVVGNTAEAIGAVEKAGGSAQGGGIAIVEGHFSVERSTISGNVVNAGGGKGPADAGQDGGASFAAGFLGVNPETGPSTISGSTISGNIAESPGGPGGTGGETVGGGIFTVTVKQPLALTNSTVAGNVVRNGANGGAPGIGGGVFLLAVEAGATTITSSTIAANRVESTTTESQGGNAFLAGTASAIAFRNSVIANGLGPAGTENCSVLPTGPEISVVSQGFNIDSRDQCNFKGNGDRVNTDPLLGPLQANGGLTATMAPAIGSPAIDQGAAFGLSADQRSVIRPIDLPSIANSPAPGADGSDIGAVEVQPSNAFTFGKVKKNKKKGTATVVIKLPQPSLGVLSLKGKGLKPVTTKVTGQPELKLKIAAKSKKVRKALKKKGKRKVRVEVTYTPTGNSAATKSLKTKLIQKKKRRKKGKK
jgi:hypothetical protein